MNFVPGEKAFPIRQPSTANLMLDSSDRNLTRNPSAWDFQITRTNSILNGFFTRIGATEVVMEWCEDNILSSAADPSGNIMYVDISGYGGNPVTISFDAGAYTVAQTMEKVVFELNDISGITGAFFACNRVAGEVVLQGTQDFKIRSSTSLPERLDITPLDQYEGFVNLVCPDLRLYRYVDIVSADLTYNQDLKDSSTATLVRDVIVRWYMDDDTPEALDTLGFPILMGYTRFAQRRIFNPPKQIKWDNNLPLAGFLRFSVYGDDGEIVTENTLPSESDWLMTLQFTEN